MFQSILYIKFLGCDEKTKIHSYEYELTDSDFSCVVVSGRLSAAIGIRVVIQEYSKRNLNVAANLVKFFLYYEKEYGFSIAKQIEQAEQFQPLFTPQLKADLQKYLLLL